MLHARHLEPLQFIGNDFLVVFVGCDVQKRRRGGGKLSGFSTCPRQYPRPRLALPPLKPSSTSSYVSNPKSSLPMPFPQEVSLYLCPISLETKTLTVLNNHLRRQNQKLNKKTRTT